ncbi:signal peptidase I [Pyrococcus yayanosii]|uniref:Signal peptidase n=1 Tax=Pyrococcus yayanosii (strain CH1 / JCM 16557) TaxID=529709 RepID=F8AET9_PYRYC|nr:signal peptidase I [Pyrococcus yayanosii]AEH24771.1 signal peptidase [Pyrococcus yayanosii CH1]
MERWIEETVALILLILLVLGIQTGLKVILHTDSPLVIVVSGSMEPVFYRGDVVLLEGVKPEDVKVGDVIVYKSPLSKYPIIHRVRKIKTVEIGGREELCFVTWGDNNQIPDIYPLGVRVLDCVPGYAVEAKALLVFPKIGLIPLEIRERLGLLGG